MNQNQAHPITLALTALICCALEDALANEPIVIGHETTIESEILGENRRLLIGEPHGYRAGSNHYPMILLLDGDANFHTVTGIVGSLVRGQAMPPTFVVGIPNTVRRRDLTPTTQVESERQLAHGGAGKFLDFITQELVPWMNENYRVHPYTILVGHSLGGLFTASAMASAPSSFDAYVIVSPSLEWNEERTLEHAAETISSRASWPATVYVSIANEGGPMLASTEKFVGLLDAHNPKDFVWGYDRVVDENHMTIPSMAVRAGLKLVFSDWNIDEPLTAYDSGGIEAIHAFYRNADRRYKTNRGTPAAALPTLGAWLLSSNRLDDAKLVLLDANTPPNPNLLARLGTAFEAAGKRTAALDVFRHLRDSYPENTAARAALERLEPDWRLPGRTEPI